MNCPSRLSEKLRFPLHQPLIQTMLWAFLFAALTFSVSIQWQHLEAADVALLRLVNKTLASEWLDAAMSFFSQLGNQPIAWMLLVGWLGYRSWHENGDRQRKMTRWIYAVLMVAIALGLADGLSGRVVKPMIGRERPVKIVKGLRLVDGGGKAKSFPSSHAANAFAVARVLHEIAPPRALWWFLATTVSLSRIYLGAHFPSDVVGGALLGLSVGAAIVSLKRRWQK
ncbi:MAG: phosphatase PAP2 family protein [Candidatus Fervidibacter sp.]|uniref:phosphatase PAP2 family protein n=1 Tax=Candidatus Fervidibacter sp. TaxID=3100871 RepID=UPI00404A9B5A